MNCFCYSGTKIQALTNCVKLEIEPDRGVYEYEVRFEPNVHSVHIRFKLLIQHENVVGRVRTFDGALLCLPIKLDERVTRLESKNPTDDTTIQIQIIFKKKKRFADCAQLYGILFGRIMKVLKFVRFGRKDFDPTAPKIIPQHKLEIWPGYVTAVEDCEGGVLLCVDVTSRVLRQEW